MQVLTTLVLFNQYAAYDLYLYLIINSQQYKISQKVPP